MRRRARLKRKYFVHHVSKIQKIILIVILLIIMLFFSFRYLNKKASPIFSEYAEMEIKKLSNIIINRAVSKQMVENASTENMFIVDKDSKGEIQTIDFNPVLVNKFLSTTVNSIQLGLKQIEEGNVDLLELPDDILIHYDKEKLKKGIIYEIPTGVIFGNSFLSNLGPKIPIRFNLIGDISGNINTKVTNYGINNAMIEVTLHIKLTEVVLMPFISKKIKVESNIPISIKIIEGNVPTYYLSGVDRQSSTITIPTS